MLQHIVIHHPLSIHYFWIYYGYDIGESKGLEPMARKPVTESFQTTIVLPQDLHERLKAAGGERGMGKEIRQRLEASFAGETPIPKVDDQALSDVLEDIAGIASNLAFDAEWTADAWTFRAFRAAVETLLEAHRPKSTLKVVRVLFPITDDPQVVGRTLAGQTLAARRKV